MGAMRAIFDSGLRIPEDIAVGGGGNLLYSDFLRIPLSSIDQDSAAIGEGAGNPALARVESRKPLRPESIVASPKLIVRASSLRLADGRRIAPVSFLILDRPLGMVIPFGRMVSRNLAVHGEDKTMQARKWKSRDLALRFAAISILAGGAAVFAQVQAGRMVGAVYDPQRATVPGATVTDVATNQSKRVTADGNGGYVITPLDPGIYSLSATAPGFETTIRGGIELTVGQAARVDLELRIGETSTEVRVTAETPLLNTETGTLGQVITNTQITDLPLNGRSFTELARLTPGRPCCLRPATCSWFGRSW
jgi:Carboxypeptidase regulatory-like domain/Periplasmic binding protein-like domain